LRGVLAVAALVVTACGTSGHYIPPGLGNAFSQAVEDGRHLKVPTLGDVGLDEIDLAAAERELTALSRLVPDVEDAKQALTAACRAKSLYESGRAATQDEAVARAIALVDVHLSVKLISSIERRLIRDSESGNPAIAAAAAFACHWAAG
jgi:hypothetical protein